MVVSAPDVGGCERGAVGIAVESMRLGMGLWCAGMERVWDLGSDYVDKSNFFDLYIKQYFKELLGNMTNKICPTLPKDSDVQTNGTMMNANMQNLVAFFQNQAMLSQQLQPQEKEAGMIMALSAMQKTKGRKIKCTPVEARSHGYQRIKVQTKPMVPVMLSLLLEA
ncbi:Uncharacterized protein Fot_34614 [Forsythia ovata]|uniref:Uncharacterized protein n=1 Tax=Forsythia ovata TaxID=205694 RepID=A0ABD1SJ60_9LAMI